jgi:nitroimidazol reductase NimA-like FMN-containing flavoprotein (pyridoxamine 5'-phosphate oxidase superfamily)
MYSTAVDEPIGPTEALSLLRASPVGRVAFMVDDQPWVLPVNIAADDEGRVVFRTGQHSALSSLSSRKVAVEIDSYSEATRSGWYVLVTGIAREITDAADVGGQRLRQLGVRPWAAGTRNRWFAVLPMAISGQRIGPADLAGEDWFAGVPTS